MTTTHIDRLRCVVTNTPGTSGDVVVGAAPAGRRTFSAAENGKTFEPTFEEGASWETRTGCIYTHSTQTLTRGTLLASSTGSAIALTSLATVSIGPTAKALQDLEPARGMASTPRVYHVGGYGVAANGSDQSAALSALLAIVYAAGGGVLMFGTGAYRFDTQITLPYDGSALSPKGVPIQFVGAGEWWSGKSSASPANGGTIFDIRYSGSEAWLMCLHEGTFSARHITFSQRGTAHTTPYIKTTNTTLQIDQCSFEGHATKGATTADQDCIILGGTSNASFGGNAVDQPFQGYGTVISRNNFNRIRRGVYGRVYANAVVIRDNNFWAQCGDAGVSAGAIEFDSGTTDFCVGGSISGNLIECIGYSKPIKLVKCSQMTLIANSFYDRGASLAGYINMSGCVLMGVVGGAFDDTKGPYVSDGTQCSFVISAGDTSPVQLQFVKAGKAGYPNLLSYTKFTGPNQSLTVQPDLAMVGSARMAQVLRSAAEASDANAEIFAFWYDGSITCGNASAPGQGNITTTMASATSWSSNGRRWACNGMGADMSQYSGSGGSYYKARNYSFQFRRHSDDSLVAEVGPVYGGSGYEGIGFGASKDVAIFRAGTALGGTTGVIASQTSTVAALPTPVALMKGAPAFATNGRKSGEGAGAGTGIPVWCDGTNWRTYYDNTVAAA